MPVFRQSSYRWTNQFFQKDLPTIPSSKRRVFDAFRKHTGLDQENLWRAFRPGFEPVARVMHLPGRYGYTPPIGNEIQLAKVFIEEMEAVLPANKVPRGRVYAPSELETQLLWILEATVLHEMVHFCRFKFNEAAKQNLRSARGMGHEEAVARHFETVAYGKQMTVHSMGIARYMPKTAGLGPK